MTDKYTGQEGINFKDLGEWKTLFDVKDYNGMVSFYIIRQNSDFSRDVLQADGSIVKVPPNTTIEPTAKPLVKIKYDKLIYPYEILKKQK